MAHVRGCRTAAQLPARAVDRAQRRSHPLRQRQRAAVEYSRGAQYAIDGASRTIRQVWEYVDPTYHPPLFGPWLGNALAFPGGTALVNDAGINDPNLIYLRMAKLTEVRKSDNQKVWELVVRDPANLEGYNGFDAEKIQSLYPP
jgi:hypothetical protein